MSCVKEKEGQFILKYAKDTHDSLTGLFNIIEDIRCRTFPGSSSSCKREDYAPFPFPNRYISDKLIFYNSNFIKSFSQRRNFKGIKVQVFGC